jgi:hypothetical protein
MHSTLARFARRDVVGIAYARGQAGRPEIGPRGAGRGASHARAASEACRVLEGGGVAGFLVLLQVAALAQKVSISHFCSFLGPQVFPLLVGLEGGGDALVVSSLSYLCWVDSGGNFFCLEFFTPGGLMDARAGGVLAYCCNCKRRIHWYTSYTHTHTSN